MRLAVFVIAFVLGALVSAAWIDDTTICPAVREGQGFEIRITAWPPLALECEGKTYVPWWEWLCVAISAAGVALFSFSPPRAALTIVLLFGGGLAWFAGPPL